MNKNELFEAESNVIGSLFIDPSLINEVIEKVEIDAFEPPNNSIISAINRIVKGESQHYKKVGILTVWKILQKGKSKVSQKYIRDIVSNVVSTAEFEDSINIIADAAVRRNILSSLENIKIMIKSDEDLDNVLSETDKVRISMNEQMARFDKQLTLSDHLDATYKEIERISKNKGKMTGIPSGYPRLDFFTGGFQKEFIVIGGRPSMGKTAFALNICSNNVKYYGYKPAFFSYEMRVQALLMRLVCTEARISSQLLKHGGLRDKDKLRLEMAIKRYQGFDMYIDDRQYDIDVLASKIETVKQQHNIDFVIVDYIQLIPVNKRSREEEISYISRTLKGVVMRLGIPIIALSQLSRRSARKGGAPPTLDDLRESGAIEQDADVVIFPHRPIYYGIRKKGGRSMANVAEMHIAKQRNGPTGMAEIVWNQQFASFENPAMHWSHVKKD